MLNKFSFFNITCAYIVLILLNLFFLQHNCILKFILRPLHSLSFHLHNQLLILALFFFTGFSGIVFYLFGDKLLEKIKFPGLFFALGTLGGTVFFHLLPEYIEHHENDMLYVFLAIPGFLVWFIPVFFKNKKEESKYSIVALMAGDALHNAFTSILWLSLCIASGRIEFMILPAIMLHEIPHKVGNFGIMIFSGMSKKRALIYSVIASSFFFTALFLYNVDVHIDGKIFIPIIVGTLCYTFFSGIYHERQSLKGKNLYWLAAGLFLMIFVNLLTGEMH